MPAVQCYGQSEVRFYCGAGPAAVRRERRWITSSRCQEALAGIRNSPVMLSCTAVPSAAQLRGNEAIEVAHCGGVIAQAGGVGVDGGESAVTSDGPGHQRVHDERAVWFPESSTPPTPRNGGDNRGLPSESLMKVRPLSAGTIRPLRSSTMSAWPSSSQARTGLLP